MNKLHIYGCSFSSYYFSDKVDKFWFEILGDYFNLDLNHRAVSAYGWQRIRYRIFEDAIYWDKNDLIIICPSFFTRLDIVDFNIDRPDSRLIPPWVEHLDNLDKRDKFYHDDYLNTVKTLKLLNKNVFTWSLDKVDSKYRKESYIINPPDNFDSWIKWNDSDSRNWVIPYSHAGGDGGSIIDKDSHFSSHAHRIVGEHMIKFIREQYKIKTAI